MLQVENNNFQKVPLDHYLIKTFDIFIYTAVLTSRIPVQMPIKKEKGISEIINLYFKHYNCVIFNFGAKKYYISMICTHALIIWWFQVSSRDVSTVLLPMQNWKKISQKDQRWDFNLKIALSFFVRLQDQPDQFL